MNDDFLNRFRKPPRREFADTLYQRITKPMPNQPKYPALRKIALTVAIFAALGAVLFFSPTARAFADSLIRQVGGYIFVQGPIQPNPDRAKAVIKKDALTPDQVATLEAAKLKGGKSETAPDAAGASALAGFAVLSPAYLPDGFTPANASRMANPWTIERSDNGISATLVFNGPAAAAAKDSETEHLQETKKAQSSSGKVVDGGAGQVSSKGDADFLAIEELKHADGKPTQTYDRPEIVDVTVRGVPGVWLPVENGKNCLVWEENGITYTLTTHSLSLEQMLKIAESLGK